MIAVALALAAALMYGSADFIAGLAARRASVFAITALSQLAGFSVVVLCLLTIAPGTPTSRDLVLGVAAGLAAPACLLLLYRALALGTISIVAPVSAVCAIAFPVVFGLVAGQRPGSIVLLGIAVAMIAVFLLGSPGQSVGPGEPRLSAAERFAPLGLAVAAGLMGGLFYVALNSTASRAGLWPLFAARVAGVVLLLGGGALAGRLRTWASQAALVPQVAAAGVLDALGSTAYLLAVRREAMAIVVTLVCLYPAMTVFLARVWLGERLGRVQQCGLVLAAIAIVLITRH